MCRIRILFFIAASLAFSSCSKNAGALYDGESGFAFASSVLYAEVSQDDKGLLEVPVYRGLSGKTIQAPIRFQYDTAAYSASDPQWADADPRGVFSLVSSKVTFAENSCKAVVRVKVSDLDRLSVNDKYRMRLTITDGVSPSGKDDVVISVTKKLVFEKYGDCSWFDECIFEKAYNTEIYKASGEEIYRVLDPYKEGLVAEEYAAEGWMGTTPDYVEFTVSGNHISFSQFPTGMLFNKTHMAWAYYPSDYKWGRDFSSYDAKCLKLNDKHFQFYAVYCLPTYQYGYMNDGAYMVDINVF